MPLAALVLLSGTFLDEASFGYDFWRSLTFPDVYELTFREQTLVSVGRTWQEDGE